MVLLFLRLIIRLEVRAIATFVFVEYPAAIQRSGGNGANEQQREKSAEAAHREVCISNITKKLLSY